MRGLLRFAFAAALVAGSAATPALAEDSPVLGSWNTAVESQMGKFESVMTIAAADEGYTVEIVDKPPEGGAGGPGGPPPDMESTISDVVVEGNSLAFKRTIKMGPGQEFVLNYATTVEGDTMTGEAGSDFGAMALTATRSTE